MQWEVDGMVMVCFCHVGLVLKVGECLLRWHDALGRELFGRNNEVLL